MLFKFILTALTQLTNWLAGSHYFYNFFLLLALFIGGGGGSVLSFPCKCRTVRFPLRFSQSLPSLDSLITAAAAAAAGKASLVA